MVISTDEIREICRRVTKEVARAYDDLSLHFVVHQSGTLRDSIALSEHDMVSHPAQEAARSILKKQIKNDNSNFLGLAISSKSKFFGLKRIDRILGLFNVNADEFKTLEEAELRIYHLAWHAIDLYEIRKNPQYMKKFQKGAMIPKRSPLNLSKSHLQADAFSCLIKALKENVNISEELGLKRAKQSLNPVTNFKAEDYPFVVAMEACSFSIEEILGKDFTDINIIILARKMSLDVGHAFDENSIKQWWEFCLPAQDMAWRGSPAEEVLGAALNTSDNPFVRSIAYLINDICDIDAASAESLSGVYNPFLNPDDILNIHRDMVDAAFEQAIAEGIKDASPEAFMKAANLQNENLTEGRIVGWCANALQNAGKAFEAALHSGTQPEQAARMNFTTADPLPSWDSLKDLGKKIVDEKRKGFAVTMGHIAEVCHNNDAFSQVLDSIKITMNDPSYIQKLEAANDLNFVPAGPAINAPAPQGPAPTGPSGPQMSGPAMNGPAATPTPMPAPGMGGPGGGGNRNAQIMHQRRMMAEKQKQEALAKGNQDKTSKE